MNNKNSIKNKCIKILEIVGTIIIIASLITIFMMFSKFDFVTKATYQSWNAKSQEIYDNTTIIISILTNKFFLIALIILIALLVKYIISSSDSNRQELIFGYMNSKEEFRTKIEKLISNINGNNNIDITLFTHYCNYENEMIKGKIDGGTAFVGLGVGMTGLFLSCALINNSSDPEALIFMEHIAILACAIVFIICNVYKIQKLNKLNEEYILYKIALEYLGKNCNNN